MLLTSLNSINWTSRPVEHSTTSLKWKKRKKMLKLNRWPSCFHSNPWVPFKTKKSICCSSLKVFFSCLTLDLILGNCCLNRATDEFLLCNQIYPRGNGPMDCLQPRWPGFDPCCQQNSDVLFKWFLSSSQLWGGKNRTRRDERVPKNVEKRKEIYEKLW